MARDAALEIAAAAAMAADAGQTFTATRNCIEINPAIGSCGQRVPVIAYFATAIVAHAMLSRALPEGWWRTTFQAVTVGIEVDTIYWNWRAEQAWDRWHLASER